VLLVGDQRQAWAGPDETVALYHGVAGYAPQLLFIEEAGRFWTRLAPQTPAVTGHLARLAGLPAAVDTETAALKVMSAAVSR
jgi:hypothetical protein